ncbi:MAG: site-specific DNA-methyltransferase [Anaerolineaceae bacterium]|nr:site-specific DNA-methyltransferase [Anaerolineaceae bacterium]
MQTNVRAGRDLGLSHDNPFPTPIVLGYRPTCACPEHEPVPGWCLDPFVGSGTTIEVAQELGVNVVGLDIAPAYLDRHCKPRVGVTPAGALEELPLFGAQLAQSLTTQETPHD